MSRLIEMYNANDVNKQIECAFTSHSSGMLDARGTERPVKLYTPVNCTVQQIIREGVRVKEKEREGAIYVFAMNIVRNR